MYKYRIFINGQRQKEAIMPNVTVNISFQDSLLSEFYKTAKKEF